MPNLNRIAQQYTEMKTKWWAISFAWPDHYFFSAMVAYRRLLWKKGLVYFSITSHLSHFVSANYSELIVDHMRLQLSPKQAIEW